MMRNGLMIVAGFAALLACARPAGAQAVPDAPQPQKKAATTPKNPPDPAPPVPSKDENAFPETVSRQAAEAAQKTDDKSPKSDTSTGDANPFPEAVSRDAAKEAGSGGPPRTDLPPGVSSSQSQDSVQDVPAIDPVRAQKDTEVGSYYLKTYDYQGALLRFHDAIAADPTNVDAIFGLAEAQRSLGKKSDAARQYRLYLDIVPNGPKAKEARKALKSLSAGT